jgi:hypothetical protein
MMKDFTAADESYSSCEKAQSVYLWNMKIRNRVSEKLFL